VFCVFEHRYRSRAVADAIVEGRFPIQGRTIDLGTEPDWLGASLPADREWRLEWSKFYYGLDLATAAEQTRNPEYAAAWQRLVDSWIAQVPIDHDPSDVIGRRVQNWLYAWSRFERCIDFQSRAPGFEARICDSLQAQAVHLQRNLTRERNHRTLELYALFIAALALPAIDADGRLLPFAIDALHQNLLEDVLRDGVQRERSTHYHHVVLRSFVGLLVNTRRFAIPLPAGFESRLTRACEFALHCHRPDGSIPALSDSDSGSYLDLLEVAGEILDRPDFIYVATRGRRGEPPRATAASFPIGGYFIQRSGWGTGARALRRERYLIFDCGPVGDGGHGHYDALNVEIAADGAPLVIDPGRYTYCDDPPHWRRWFKGSAAHNTVTVDGLDQTPYRRGKPKGPVANVRLRRRATRPSFDLLWGEVVSPLYEVVHRRRILFVGNDYWLIEDELEGDRPHRFDLRFHLTPDQPHVDVAATASGWRARTSRTVIMFAGDATAHVESGWVSSEYGRKDPAPILTFTREGVECARFVTLIAPCGANQPSDLRVELEGEIAAARISCATNGEDRVEWTLDGRPRRTEGASESMLARWTRHVSSRSTARQVQLSRDDVVLGPSFSAGASS
jgi:hypothetical protein